MTRTAHRFHLLFGVYTFSAFFIAPVYPLFLISRGLDLFQINVVLAVYLVTVFAFEVPTGAVADRYGRKVSLLGSCALRLVAYVLYASADGFADCIVAEVIDAVGTTLASGALEAWAVDGVRREGDDRPTDRMFARAQVISRSAMIGGGVACGYLAERGIEIAWYTAAAGFAATAILALVLMDEERRPPASGRRRSFVGAMRDDVLTVRGAPMLLVLCGLTFAGAFAAFPLHMLWQPHMHALAGEGYRVVGWIWALLNLASVVGSGLLPRLLERMGRRTVLVAATLWRAGTLGVAAAATSIAPALAGLLLQEIAYGASEPVLTAWTNEHIAPERRATVLSVRSTFFTLGGALGLVAIGLVARGWGIPVAWGVSAVVFALTAPAFLLLHRVGDRAEPIPLAPPSPGPGHVG